MCGLQSHWDRGRESWRWHTDLTASYWKQYISLPFRDHWPLMMIWPHLNSEGGWKYSDIYECLMNSKNLCHILTLLPPYFLPYRTEPQSSPMVPAQDGPSEKLSQPLATEVLGSNSWERGKACQEASPARAHRWDPAPAPLFNLTRKFNLRMEKWSLSLWPFFPSRFCKFLFEILNQIKTHLRIRWKLWMPRILPKFCVPFQRTHRPLRLMNRSL